MIPLIGFLVGVAVSVALLHLLRPLFLRPVFQRTNYRGAPVSTAAGLVVVAATLFGAAALAVARSLGAHTEASVAVAMSSTALVVTGFGLLGLLDDVAEDHGSSGYRGHLRELAKGSMTAGSLKMLAGPAVAILAVQPISGDNFWSLMLDGAIVALCANMANLLDTGPGRVTKTAIVGLAALVISVSVADLGALPLLVGAAVTVGAACAVLFQELKERMMLGDTGANPVGAVIGLGVVLTQSLNVRIAVFAAILILNLLSERFSFKSVIQNTPPLRWVDRLGRVH